MHYIFRVSLIKGCAVVMGSIPTDTKKQITDLISKICTYIYPFFVSMKPMYMHCGHRVRHSWGETYKQWPHNASQWWTVFTQLEWDICMIQVHYSCSHSNHIVADTWHETYMHTYHMMPHGSTCISRCKAGLRYPHWLYSASQLNQHPAATLP
jgi:hypothetical protein